MCTCGREIGRYQYELGALKSFRSFYPGEEFKDIQFILFGDQANRQTAGQFTEGSSLEQLIGALVERERLGLCCQMNIRWSASSVITNRHDTGGVSQQSSSHHSQDERIVPTLLPSPLRSANVLRWYGR